MSYSIKPFPPLRRMLSDAWAVIESNNTFAALIEVDLTKVRYLMSQYAQQNAEKLSLTAYITFCVAKTVEEHKEICALRSWNGDVVTFNDVDINVLIEKEVDGNLMGLAHVIRAANKKSFLAIHSNIRTAQKSTAEEVAGIKGYEKIMQILIALPGFVRRLIWRVLLVNPHFIKKVMGTVSVSAVGMAGKGGGWGIPAKTLTFSMVIGGISEKTVLHSDGSVNAHQFLHLTFLFNHEIVDGAPAARFIKDLKEMIESAAAIEMLL